ncbi:extensin [Iris pallida]|uniref:Extensin n=1 Tax=Iris pallida TaxID=29817 RepID=A0AAX6I394_IRIPA|nr:extensin [Iris pallida]
MADLTAKWWRARGTKRGSSRGVSAGVGVAARGGGEEGLGGAENGTWCSRSKTIAYSRGICRLATSAAAEERSRKSEESIARRCYRAWRGLLALGR